MLGAFGAKVHDELELRKPTGKLLAAINATVQPVQVSLVSRPEHESIEDWFPKLFTLQNEIPSPMLPVTFAVTVP